VESRNVSNDSAVSQDPVIVLDSKDYPHLTWNDTVNIYYIRWNGSAWVDSTGSTSMNYKIMSSGIGTSPADNQALELDSGDMPHISWYSGSGSDSEVYYLYQGDSAYEPNDEFTAAYTIDKDTTIYAYLWDDTDNDKYKFYIAEAGTITVNLSSLPADYDMALYSPGPTFAEQSANSGTTAEQIQRYLDGSATYYYVSIYGGGTNYCSTNTYSLELSFSSSTVGTFVSGLISSDTTWSAANSPYIVTANIAVAASVTLTIEPGVTVKFSTGTYLQIEGALDAQGTVGNKITFTSNEESPSSGDWEYIKFTDSSDDANCVVSYADLKYAINGFYCDYSSPTITYSTASYNKSWGIYCSQSSPVIKYNYVHNNGAGADYTAGIYVYGSPLVEGNTVSNNNKYGIACYGGSPEIKNNTISNNTVDGIYSTNTDLIVRNNTISDNGVHGVYFGGDNVTLTGNRIFDNLGILVIALLSLPKTILTTAREPLIL